MRGFEARAFARICVAILAASTVAGCVTFPAKDDLARGGFRVEPGPVIGGIAAVARFDGDADLDAYVGSDVGGRLLLGDGSGGFRDATVSSGAACERCRVRAIALGDVDADGATDVVLLTEMRGVVVYGNDGDASFTVLAGLPGVKGDAITLIDLDDDRDLDLVIASTTAPLRLARNDGAGAFAPPEPLAQVRGSVFTFAFVDADAGIDLVIADADGNVRVLLQNASAPGSFDDVAGGAGLFDAGRVRTLVSADFNNDGRADLLLGGERGARIFENAGGGRFTDVTVAWGLDARNASAAVAFDADNDGWEDVVESSDGGARLWRSQGREGAARFPAIPLPIAFPASFAVADFDGDGRVDVLVLGKAENSVLLVNRLEAPASLGLRLTSTTANAGSVGARVSMATSSGNLTRLIGGGGSPASSQSDEPVFGVARAVDGPLTVTITWPSGITQVRDVPVACIGRVVHVIEDRAIAC